MDWTCTVAQHEARWHSACREETPLVLFSTQQKVNESEKSAIVDWVRESRVWPMTTLIVPDNSLFWQTLWPRRHRDVPVRVNPLTLGHSTSSMASKHA
jgi:hypothetical protein